MGVVLNVCIDRLQIVFLPGNFPGNRGHGRIVAGHARRFRIRGHCLAFDLRIILIEPGVALRQCLRVRANAGNAIHGAGLGHQAVMYRNRNFTADAQGRLQQQIERAVDDAFGRILNRDHAEISRAGFGIAEHFVDGNTWQSCDCMSELLIYRLLAEGAFRSQIGNRHALFKRPAGRHDFTENGLDIDAQQRPRIAFGRLAQYLRLAFRTKHRRIGFGFDVANLLRHPRALIEQVENLGIDCIDLLTQRQEFIVTHDGLSCCIV